MDYKIADFKFILPPIIALLFVISALIAVDYCGTISFIESIEPILSIAIGASLILALGFLISTTSYFFLGLLFGFPYPCWNKIEKAEEKLKKLYPNWPDGKFSKTAKGELAEWLLHSTLPKEVQKKIQKRWEMILLNANSVAALLLFIPISITIMQIKNIPHIWWYAWFIFLVFFLYNFWRAYESLREFNHILVDSAVNKPKKQRNNFIALWLKTL